MTAREIAEPLGTNEIVELPRLPRGPEDALSLAIAARRQLNSGRTTRMM